MPKSLKVTGFVIGKRNFGEADQIIKLLTLEKGKMSAVAKGVRRLTSKKRGALEIFTQANIFLQFQNKADSMGMILEASPINLWSEVKDDLNKSSVAYFMCEVCDKLAHDGDDTQKLYKLLRKALIELSKENVNLKHLRNTFSKGALTLQGFWPEGEEISDPDAAIRDIIQGELKSVRVGKKLVK